jgi:hypothetical protein
MSTRFAVAALDTPVMWSVEGVSEESRKIRALVTRISSQQRILASFAWKDSLLDEISQVSQSCEEQGWDGYDAEPISNESAIRAAQLIELLPNSIQTPNVVPEPSGHISLEWRTDDQKDFSLGVSGQNLVYAGIFGGSSKAYGEERFARVLPRTVLEILTSYFLEV